MTTSSHSLKSLLHSRDPNSGQLRESMLRLTRPVAPAGSRLDWTSAGDLPQLSPGKSSQEEGQAAGRKPGNCIVSWRLAGPATVVVVVLRSAVVASAAWAWNSALYLGKSL